MYKHIRTSVKTTILGLSLILSASTASAALIVVPAHIQMGLGTELITSIPIPGLGGAVDTLDILVTNNTGVNWTDYHFLLTDPSLPTGVDESFTILAGSVVLLPNPAGVAVEGAVPFLDFALSDPLVTLDDQNGNIRELWLFNGLLAPGDSFNIQFDVGYINTSVDINGTPSVPIPAAVWLFGSGLLGLVGMARRRV